MMRMVILMVRYLFRYEYILGREARLLGIERGQI